MRPEIAAVLAELGLEDEAAALEPFAHVEIAFIEGGTGATRIGGPALLPRPEAWPVHRWSLSEVEGWPDYTRADLASARARGEVREEGGELLMPLSFLCQVDLAETRAERLPQRGVMLFFASVTTDVADPRFAKCVASAVCLVDANDCIEVAQPPTADPFPDGVIALRPERRVHFELPWEELQRVQARLTGHSLARFDALCVQGDALLPAPTEETTGPMPPPGEVALLRLMSHDDLGLVIGDSSWLTFCIPEVDLAAGRFEAARASVYIG